MRRAAFTGRRSRRSALAFRAWPPRSRHSASCRRPRRDVRLQHVPAPGALLRGAVHGGGAPHLNIRLHVDQTAWIANHAGDRVVFVDAPLLPAFAAVAPQLTSVKHVVVMGEADTSLIPSSRDYEELLAAAAPEYSWPEPDENDAAAMCYTSGTTGNPRASSTRIGRRSYTRRR